MRDIGPVLKERKKIVKSVGRAEKKAGLLGGGLESPASAKSLQSCLTLCDPRDGSPPESAIPGILQARTLEWVAISFSNV